MIWRRMIWRGWQVLPFVFCPDKLIISKHVALRPHKRDDLLGTGKGGWGRKSEWLDREFRPRKTVGNKQRSFEPFICSAPVWPSGKALGW